MLPRCLEVRNITMCRHRVTRLERNTAMVHCNMYRHLAVRQLEDVHYWSSQARHARLDSRAGQIKTEEEVRFWLGDQEGELPVFRTDDKEKDVLLTLATGTSHQVILPLVPNRNVDFHFAFSFHLIFRSL